MRVRLLRQDTVDDFAENHANGRIHFNSFLQALKYADWQRAEDITSTIRGNLLGGGSNRVVFDLGGNGRNAFRIICMYAFGRQLVRLYVTWIGTHEQYNALTPQNKLTVWNH